MPQCSVESPGVDSQAGGIGECDMCAGDGPRTGPCRSVDVGSPAATCVGLYGESGAGGDTWDSADGVVELVERLTCVGLRIASGDGSAIRRNDDVVQRSGDDGQAGGIRESDAVAGYCPDTGLGRSIDIGGPVTACARIYREYGAAGDIGDGVIELVERPSRIGLAVAGGDGGAIR